MHGIGVQTALDSPGRRSRARLLGAAAAVIALGATLGTADARAESAPTLSAAENFVVFDQHATLTGAASTARVTLIARRFGQTGYSRVATATVRDGAFRFSPVPILATRYEVVAGTGTDPAAPHSRSVQIYVHLDAGPVTCNLCHPGHPVGAQTLRLAQTVRVPAPARRAILAAPTYVYVGTAATGKVQSLRRVAKITPHALGPDAMRLQASVPVDLPASGKFRYLLCGRADERATGVGLPSVHDCGEPTLNRGQFRRYVG